MKAVLIVAPLTGDALARYAQAADELDIEACFLLPRETNIKHDLALLKDRRVAYVDRIENKSEEVLQAVVDFGRLDGIVAGGEFSVGAVEHASRFLGLPTSLGGDPLVLRNKAVMRRAFERQGVPQPRLYGAATDPAGVQAILARVERYPVISKPADMAGSWYVALNHDADSVLANAAPIFADRVALSTGLTFSGECLVEEFFDGSEYSAEVVVQDGSVDRLFVTRKYTSPLPYFDEIGHLSGPEVLGTELRTRVEDAATRVVAAADVRASIVHMEFKVSRDGRIAVIEAACRVAGDRISTLVQRAFGFNLEKANVCLKAGLDPAKAATVAYVPTYCGVRFAFAGLPLTRIPGATTLGEASEPDRPPVEGFSRTHLVNRLGYQLVQVDSPAAFSTNLAVS